MRMALFALVGLLFSNHISPIMAKKGPYPPKATYESCQKYMDYINGGIDNLHELIPGDINGPHKTTELGVIGWAIPYPMAFGFGIAWAKIMHKTTKLSQFDDHYKGDYCDPFYKFAKTHHLEKGMCQRIKKGTFVSAKWRGPKHWRGADHCCNIFFQDDRCGRSTHGKALAAIPNMESGKCHIVTNNSDTTEFAMRPMSIWQFCPLPKDLKIAEEHPVQEGEGV